MSNNTNTPAVDQNQVGIGGYISLIFAIVFFSGLCASKQWWASLTSRPSTALSASS